jgi:hypothetical protein
MSRSLRFVAMCALALVFCVPGHGQDSPSLGDLARQAQKDKEKSNKPAGKVLTNDDLSSNTAGDPSALGAGLGRIAQPGVAGKPGATASPAAMSPSEQLEKLESILSVVDSLDRATLVRNVLQGSDTDFPGRDKWEERLFAAKQTYVTEGRALLEKAKQIKVLSESLQGVKDTNDPRVKDLGSRLQQFIQDGTRIGASFQAVMLEGKDLAGQAASH